MDAIEFAKTVRKICRSHTSCVECEFIKVQGHCGITNPEADHAGMVAVAEQWAREHTHEVTHAEIASLRGACEMLKRRLVTAAEKVDKFVGFAEYAKAVGNNYHGSACENYDLAREMIEEYNAALEEIERREK